MYNTEILDPWNHRTLEPWNREAVDDDEEGEGGEEMKKEDTLRQDNLTAST